MLQDKSPLRVQAEAKETQPHKVDLKNGKDGDKSRNGKSTGRASPATYSLNDPVQPSKKPSLVKTVPDRVKRNTINMPARTSSNSDMHNKAIVERDVLTARILKTKKETDELKEQLQKLLKDGIRKTDVTEIKQSVTTLSTDFKSVADDEPVSNSHSIKMSKANSELDLNKARTFKDSIADIIGTSTVNRQSVLPVTHSKGTLTGKHKSPLKNPEDKPEGSPTKVRHYNRQAAREFIKKQREQRRELLKNQKKEITCTQDIKKQKLQELRQKSLQLLSKNIQNKRERSRSRSRDPLDGPEYSKPVGASLETVDVKKIAQAKPRETITRESQLVPNLIFNESTLPGVAKFPQNLEVIPNDTKLPTAKPPEPNLQNITVRSRTRNLTSMPLLDLIKQIQLNQHKQASLDLEKQNKAATKIQATFKGYLQRKSFRLTLKLKQQMNEQAKSTLAKPKQIEINEIKNDVPVWLEPPTTAPYPYNFISTVRRKLNLVVQQRAKDVGVQSSIIGDPPKLDLSVIEEAGSDIKVKSTSNHKNTDLKSFLSHKCLDLDFKTIKPLILKRNSSLGNKENSPHHGSGLKPQKLNNSSLKTELSGLVSDSDTSKNIPDISSEGSLLVGKNIKQTSKRSLSETDEENKLKINTDKVKKLKVRQPRRLDFDAVNVENTKIDFNSKTPNEDISEHIAESNSLKIKSYGVPKPIRLFEPISSRKDSIIAFNKCDYSQNKSAPSEIGTNPQSNHIHSTTSIKTQSAPRLKSTTTESLVPPKDTLTSFHEYMQNLNKEQPKSSVEEVGTKTSGAKSSLPSQADTRSKEITTEISNKSRNLIEGDSKEYSSRFTDPVSALSTLVPSLKHPSVSLKSSQRVSDFEKAKDDGVDTIKIGPAGSTTTVKTKVKSNEIHLKFEAQLSFLNTFNDSLQHVRVGEKSLQQHPANNTKATMTYQTQDTQTSIVTKNSLTESPQSIPKNGKRIPSINYSRGSDVSEDLDIRIDNSLDVTNDNSLVTTGLELSQIKDNLLTSSIEESNVDISIERKENCYNGNTHAGLSLDVFEQLIKDEDARIENLRTILKLREKALVDRTRGELAWLETQKKHLRDSGQKQEISAIKKKQRGLLIKFEHERHEMQRLKQMQKAASKERKTELQKKRNMIKAQLSNTSTMITKIKRHTKEDRRQSGPLKVYNIKNHSESIRSETSMSRRSSITEEIISVVSHSHSIVSHVTEEPIIPELVQRNNQIAPVATRSEIKTEHVKRSLLMREAALQKRRQAAEELLQWHQRLVEEERQIAELELAAITIINQVPPAADSMGSDQPAGEKHKFEGAQLNLLWRNMTGRDEKKFNNHMTYSMSKISPERFCKDAKKCALGRNKSFTRKGDKISDSDSSAIKTDVDVTDNLSQNIISELKQSKTNSRSGSVQTTNSKSASENSLKLRKSRSSDSISDVNKQKGSTIVEDAISKLLTKSSTEKGSQLTDYTSDFQSVDSDPTSRITSSIQKSVQQFLNQIEDDQKSYPKLEISKASSLGDVSELIDIIDDTTLSNKEDVITTIADRSKTIGSKRNNLEWTGKMIEDKTNEDYESNKNNITSDELKSSSFITESADIEEQLTSPKEIKNDSEEFLNKHSETNEITKDISETENEQSTEDLLKSDKPSSFSTKENSEVSDNSTSKDLITDIQKDVELQEEESSTYEQVETEKEFGNLEPPQIEEHDKPPITPTLEIKRNGEEEISSGLISGLNRVEEDSLISEIEDQVFGNGRYDQLLDLTNDNQVLREQNENQILGKHIENQVHNKSSDNQLFSKTSKDQTNTEVNENQLLNESLEDQLLSNTNEILNSEGEDQVHTETDDNQVSKSSDNDMLSKTSEDQVHTETEENQLLRKTNENRFFSQTSEDQVHSETEENQSVSETLENPLLSNTSENQGLAEIIVNQLLSASIEDHLLSKTNEKMHSKTEDQIYTETDDKDLLSKSSSNQLLSRSNENQLLVETSEDTLHTETNANQFLSKASETEVLSKTTEDQVHTQTDQSQLPSKTLEDQLFSKTNQDQVCSVTDEQQLLSKTIENQLSSETIESQLLSKTCEHQVHIKIDENHLPCQRYDDDKDKAFHKGKNELSGRIESSKLNGDASMIKTVEDDDTEVTSDDEWISHEESSSKANNQDLSGLDNVLLISTTALEKNTKVIGDDEWNKLSTKEEFTAANDVPVKVNEGNSEDREEEEHTDCLNENSIKSKADLTTTSLSEKPESPLLLSYGFVAKDTIEHLPLNNHSPEASNDVAEDDTLNQESNEILDENSTNIEDNLTDTSFSEKKEQLIEEEQDHHDGLDHDQKKKISNEVEHIDVKKRVSEILADANIPSPRGDKSPRLQDLYVTAYDVVSPEHSSDSGSPVDDLEQNFTPPRLMFGSDEVEELLKKQLEIEQEIKEIQQQQQKEHVPYVYVREIPNKPPPPYTPPVSIQAPVSGSVLPATEKQIGIITQAAAGILYTAHLNKNLQNISLSDEDKKVMQDKTNIENGCFEFIFDLCKEAAIEHYRQFESETGPSWMRLSKHSRLALGRPPNDKGLERLITKKVKQWLGYEAVKSTENNKHKWSGKKRDHVDELLVVECQGEEAEWTNYDRDELIVKDELTKDIMNMLLSETAEVFNNILNKKTFLC